MCRVSRGDVGSVDDVGDDSGLRGGISESSAVLVAAIVHRLEWLLFLSLPAPSYPLSIPFPEMAGRGGWGVEILEVMMARVFGFLSAVSFIGSFVAFTWLRGVRYRARQIFERDGAEPEPADVGSAEINAVDPDLARQERAAWITWGVLTVCFVVFGLVAVMVGD